MKMIHLQHHEKAPTTHWYHWAYVRAQVWCAQRDVPSLPHYRPKVGDTVRWAPLHRTHRNRVQISADLYQTTHHSLLITHHSSLPLQHNLPEVTILSHVLVGVLDRLHGKDPVNDRSDLP